MTVETACRQLPHSPTGGVIAVKRRAAATTAIGSNWSTMDDYADLLARLNAGVITSWHAYDAEDFPLRQVMAYHDVLIDLAGAAPEDLAPGRTIATPESPYEYGSLVLPGLLRALCAHPHPRLNIDVLAACSRGVALVTPADQMLPRGDERLLVTSVAHRVQRALPPPDESPCGPTT